MTESQKHKIIYEIELRADKDFYDKLDELVISYQKNNNLSEETKKYLNGLESDIVEAFGRFNEPYDY